VDTWFAYYDFYPEFLHFVLKIRFFLNAALSSMPFSDNGFFEQSILYSHYRIVFNLTTVFVSLFYYNTGIMEYLNNYTYVSRFVKDKYIFSKSYFKTDKQFIRDLPKNSNLHFVTNKTIFKKEKLKKLLKNKPTDLFLKSSEVLNVFKKPTEFLENYLSLETAPKVSLRY
jgi:hypothetical protein